MTIDSYLNYDNVQNSCKVCINFLKDENELFGEIREKIKSFECVNDSSSDTITIKEINNHKDEYFLIIDDLIRANECDIERCERINGNSGSGIYEGYTVLRNENEEAQKYASYKVRAEFYYAKAKKETRKEVAKEYISVADDYQAKAENAKESLEYWKRKHAEYDEIKNISSDLFSESIECRNRAKDVINEINSTFVKRSYLRKNDKQRSLIQKEWDELI